MKRKIQLTIISSILFGSTAAYSNDVQFQFRIPTKSQLSDWSGTEPIYHPWVNIGDYYDCTNWTPLADTINFGMSFIQTRSCQQNQERNVELREIDSFSGSVKTVSRKQENRSVALTESQNALGTYQNWVTYDSTFTEWDDVGVPESYGAWSPAPQSQTTQFVQTRTYKQPQERLEQPREIDTVTGDIRNLGDQLVRTQKDSRLDSRTIDVNWTNWSDTSRAGVSEWSPVAYSETADFQQTREYGQNQVRQRIYNYNGVELDRFEESRLVSPLYENRTVNVTTSDWNDTTRDNHTAWGPVNYTETENFIQNRLYSQHQTRERIYSTSGIELNRATDNRVVAAQTESRSVTVITGNWLDTTRDSYTAWEPAASAQTSNFTQSRTYTQNQRRVWTYSAGSTDLSTRTENRAVVSQTETQSVAVNWTAWANSGLPYNCTVWSPDASSVSAGQSFTQTRNCSQNQLRNRIYSVNSAPIHTAVESQTVSTIESQNSVGTRYTSEYLFSGNYPSGNGSIYYNSSWSGAHSINNHELRVYGYNDNNSQYTVTWSVCFRTPVTLTYQYVNDSEYVYDFLNIDDKNTRGIQNGEVQTSHAAGCKTIYITYYKDGSVSEKSDSGYIRRITITPR